MNFDKTNCNFSVNTDKIIRKIDKNTTKPDTSFQGVPGEPEAQEKTKRIDSALAGAYLGFTPNISKLNAEWNDAPLTREELDEITKNPDGSSMYSEREKENIMTFSTINSAAFRDLIGFKNSDGSPRFAPLDILRNAGNYNIHTQKAFLELAALETSKKEPRFTIEEISNLAGTYNIDSEAVKEISKFENKDGTPNYDTEAIIDLAPLYKDHADAIKEIKDLLAPQKDYRLDTADMYQVINLYEKYPEAFKGLMNFKDGDENLFDVQAIAFLAPMYKYYADEIKTFAEIKNEDGSQRFNGVDIASLAFSRSDAETVKELAKIKTKDGKNRFDGIDIYMLAKSYKDHADAIKELAAFEDENGNLVFDENGGKEIGLNLSAYEKNPEAVKELALMKDDKGNRLFKDDSISCLADIYNEHKESITELSKIKNNDGELRFNAKDIKNVVDAYEKHPDLFNKFEKCTKIFGLPRFDGESIKNLVNLYLDPEQKEFIDENIDKMHGVKNFSSENFVEIGMGFNSVHLEQTGDHKFRLVGKEHITDTPDATISEYTTPEGLKITQEYSTVAEFGRKSYYETITDKDGNETITLTVPDEKNPGILVVMKEVRDKNGKIIEDKKIGKIEKFGKNGEQRIITREFKSPSEIKSKQMINETPDGRFLRYELGDKTFERDFRIKDENTTETKAHGNKYEAKFNEDHIEITVSKENGEQETVMLSNKQVDFALLPLLKKLPVDYLYTFSKTGTKLLYGKDFPMLKDNAGYEKISNQLILSEKFANDPFTFAHEFGHMLDDTVFNGLNKDEKLNKIFKKELNAYKKHAPGLNEQQIEYFIKKDHKNQNGCLTEVIAETNALLSGTFHDDDVLLLRAKLLQENFPETMKYIGSKIEKYYN